MISLLYGLAAVVAFWWLMRAFSRSNPADLARLVKRIGGFALLGLAALLGMRGRIDMAILLGGAGAWLLGWSTPFSRIPGFGGNKSQGQVSRVRSAMIEMELAHDTGDLSGTVIEGPHAGRRLADLDEKALQELYDACRASDPEGVRLLEAYFDRRFTGWRQHTQGDGDAGARRETQSGAMTEEEAYQILGLQPGASPDDIRRAHRLLMKRLHPDQGGSTYLAARVNEAKDILLSRHR